MPSNSPVCSFCGREQGDVQRIVAGPKVNICDECIGLCNRLLQNQDDPQDENWAERLKVPKPHEIMNFLDRYVIGHGYAKKVLAVAVHNHYKRLKQESHFGSESDYADVEIGKSNIMLIGPTGTGKTLLARTLARMLDVPFAIVDATTLTEAGYVGEDVENILLSLIQNADMNVRRAEMGIIYVDEIAGIPEDRYLAHSLHLRRSLRGAGRHCQPPARGAHGRVLR